MKTTTAIITILFFALVWSGIVIKQESEAHQQCLEENRSLQLKNDDLQYKATAFDSSEAKTSRAYLKLEQTMKSGNLKHGKQ